jgi:hypothetical protein
MKATLKRMVKYFRLYYTPGNKEVAQMAYQSAKEYYSNNKSKYTARESQIYQAAYIRAYRRTYAKLEISRLK